MKAYTDVFGKPLTKQDIQLAVQVITEHGKATSSLLVRRLKWGYGKSLAVYEVLQDALVVGLMRSDTTRPIILRDQTMATNAALRQLKKGKK